LPALSSLSWVECEGRAFVFGREGERESARGLFGGRAARAFRGSLAVTPGPSTWLTTTARIRWPGR